jgi:hypothetical protein
LIALIDLILKIANFNFLPSYFVRVKGLTAFKIDVVKESVKDFENWLIN